jgi:P2-related tail formation protein
VFSRLPEVGYQDDPVADWLTNWADYKLVEAATLLQQLYLQVYPSDASANSLDWLASMVGLTGAYWSTGWSQAVKVAMIQAAHPVLWPNKGTFYVIEYVLSTIHGLTYTLWQQSQLVMPFSMPATFGTNNLLYYVQLPLTYSRYGSQWKEAQRTINNFSPACVQGKVSHDKFYCGFDVLGDPMF